MATPATTRHGPIVIPAPHMPAARLHLTLDPAEHQRRTLAGAGPVLDPGVLDLLLGLPAGIPVALADLTDRERKTARRLPKGAATLAAGEVTRLAVRPCTVHLATVHAPTVSKAALTRAERFAPFCARAVLATHRPHTPETLIEADYWGIGIIWQRPDGEQEVLVEPRPWRLMRHSPAGWRFVEHAYAAATAQPEEQQ